MLRLMLLRHAQAERGRAGERDFERRLDDRGRRDAPQIGAYMHDEDLLPNAAVVSPAMRTRETWELVAKALKKDGLGTEFDERLYDATPEDILGAIRDTRSNVGALVVIGHNPGLHELATWLVGSGDREAAERLREGLPTSGLVVIEFTARTWKGVGARAGRLERFVTPKWLSAAG